MTKGVKLFWGLVVLAIIVVVVALAKTPSGGPEAPSGPSQGTLTLGGVVPLTGDGAAYGIPEQRAAELAVEEINSAGGVDGRMLKINWQDGKCEAKEATSAAQSLINIENVRVIFGGACSSETLAIAPLAEAAKVIVLSPSSTSPDVTAAGEFIFRTAPSDAMAGVVAAEYAYVKLGARKAALISETKDYPQGLRKVFREKFTALGGMVVADETYNTSDTDMRTQILKIKTASPDIIYLLPQTPAPGILILKQLTASGVEAKRLTAEVIIAPAVVAENKAEVEGLVGIEPWFDAAGESASKMLANYKVKYNEEAPFPSYMANMYSQVYLMKEAIEKVGLDAEKIRDYLLGLKDWGHALGALTFDKNGDPVGVPYSVKQVTNGELKELEVYRPAIQ